LKNPQVRGRLRIVAFGVVVKRLTVNDETEASSFRTLPRESAQARGHHR
jgi:hypothetical protein